MTEIPQRCDVLVIGGGPGGSVLSTRLSQLGYEVVLLERKKHPRYTVGESVIPDLWKFLDIIGATDKIAGEGFIVKDGALVTWHGDSLLHEFGDFGYTRPALHVERDRFDHLLLEHAAEQGVQVFEETSVTGVAFADEGDSTVAYRGLADDATGKISARYVVDASGQSAVIGKQLGLRVIDDGFRYMAVWGYFKGSRFLDRNGTSHPHEMIREVHPVTSVVSLQGSGDAGWSWHIAMREETSVGLVLPLDLLREGRTDGEDWEHYLERRCRETPILGQLLADADFVKGSTRFIRSYSYSSSQVSGPGYYLVGDAAGFIDPIFSVGVVLAIYTAAVAAESIHAALRLPARAERYRRLYESQVAGRLEMSRAIALPRYRSTGQVSEVAQSVAKMLSTDAQELMYSATKLTTRDGNFVDLMGGQEVIKNPPKVTPIEKLRL